MVRNCGKTPGVSRRFKERQGDATSYHGGYKVHDNVAESVGGVLSFLNCSAHLRNTVGLLGLVC